MGYTVIMIILAVVSILTTLTVQGIKSLMKKNNSNYSANILAVVVSCVLSVAVVILYTLYTETPFTVKIGCETAVLVFLSFLVATNGYDKVVQTIKQLKNITDGKDEKNGS